MTANYISSCIYLSLTRKRVELNLMKPSNRVQILKGLHYIQLTLIFLGKFISPLPLSHSQISKKKYLIIGMSRYLTEKK